MGSTNHHGQRSFTNNGKPPVRMCHYGLVILSVYATRQLMSVVCLRVALKSLLHTSFGSTMAVISQQQKITSMFITLSPMPLTALLWRHNALEARISHLEDQNMRMQRTLGRVVETICSWDEQLVSAFGLLPLATLSSSSSRPS